MSRYRLPYSQPPPASTISSRRTPSPISRRSAFSSSKPPAGARSGARRSSPQRPDGPLPDPAHAGNPASLTTLAPPQAGEGEMKAHYTLSYARRHDRGQGVAREWRPGGGRPPEQSLGKPPPAP